MFFVCISSFMKIFLSHARNHITLYSDLWPWNWILINVLTLQSRRSNPSSCCCGWGRLQTVCREAASLPQFDWDLPQTSWLLPGALHSFLDPLSPHTDTWERSASLIKLFIKLSVLSMIILLHIRIIMWPLGVWEQHPSCSYKWPAIVPLSPTDLTELLHQTKQSDASTLAAFDSDISKKLNCCGSLGLQ